MRLSRFAVLTLAVAALAGQEWRIAKPAYPYEFPRDHFSHPDFQTEWWYYTGNLRTGDGHRFGFELTFFRQAQHLSPQQIAGSDPVWRPDQIYLAHLALSDIDGQEFFHTERLNRAGPGLAGAGFEDRKYWNGNWQVRWNLQTDGEQELQAVCEKLFLKLRLNPEKPLVINGRDGISRKGPVPDEASHYISFTRLNAAGKLHWRNRDFDVSGLAWMDHEFFTESADSDLAGWDWFAIQLDNREELMLYRLRRKSGDGEYSSGTYVDAQGKAHLLDASQFSIKPLGVWHSAESGATYPVSWNISIPSVGLELTERTALPNQELFDAKSLSPPYWEGAVSYNGTLRGATVREAGAQGVKVHGVGYLEMTGYAKAMAAVALP